MGASENPSKPLSHMQHAVYGNGDETYYDTYMNCPRMIDMLLERAGSRRFFARGETGEPHSQLNVAAVNAALWGPGMWKAMTDANALEPAIDWAALWKGSKPNHHDQVTDWTIKKLEKKFGKPETASIFSGGVARI